MLENNQSNSNNQNLVTKTVPETIVVVEIGHIQITDPVLSSQDKANTISLKSALADIFKHSAKLVTCRAVYLVGTMVGFVILSSKDTVIGGSSVN